MLGSAGHASFFPPHRDIRDRQSLSDYRQDCPSSGVTGIMADPSPVLGIKGGGGDKLFIVDDTVSRKNYTCPALMFNLIIIALSLPETGRHRRCWPAGCTPVS